MYGIQRVSFVTSIFVMSMSICTSFINL